MAIKKFLIIGPDKEEVIIKTSSSLMETLNNIHKTILKLSSGGINEDVDAIWCGQNEDGTIDQNKCRTNPPDNKDGWVQVPRDYFM